MSIVLFNVIPQLIDIVVACTYLAFKMQPWAAVIVFVTVGRGGVGAGSGRVGLGCFPPFPRRKAGAVPYVMRGRVALRLCALRGAGGSPCNHVYVGGVAQVWLCAHVETGRAACRHPVGTSGACPSSPTPCGP